MSRRISVRATGLSLVPMGISLVALFGCGGEPDCTLAMPLSDEINEVVAIESSGESACSAEKMSGIVAMHIGRSERPPGFNGVEGLDLTIAAPKLGLGSFPTNVYVAQGTRAFSSSDYGCTLTVLQYELENWTVTDFHRFAAQLTCPNPIPMLAGGSSTTITIGPTQIEGFMLDE